VGRIEYRINRGAWSPVLCPNASEASLDLKFRIPSGTIGRIEIRAVESKLGIFSNLFSGPLSGAFGSTESGGISGFVWNDINSDGVWQSIEVGVAGTTVRLLDSNGQPARTTTTIRSNDLPQGLLTGPVDGVTISSVGQEADGRISIQPDSSNIPGGKLFQPYMWSASGFRPFFRGQDTQLKLTFAKGTNSVTAHVIGAQANAIARIDGYNAAGKLVARSVSANLANRETASVSILSPLETIASVLIYGHSDTMISIDQVSYGLSSQVVTGATGAYQFPGVSTGNYSVEIVPPDSGYELVQPSNGKQNVSVSSLAGSVRGDFSLQKQISPWQNQVQREDVDNDQLITAIDVLVLINEINRNGARELVSSDGPSPPFWDVNGDRILEALD
ncbi:MAG: SdrD B-like domain-containing protein, partial [Pirellula sp.]